HGAADCVIVAARAGGALGGLAIGGGGSSAVAGWLWDAAAQPAGAGIDAGAEIGVPRGKDASSGDGGAAATTVVGATVGRRPSPGAADTRVASSRQPAEKFASLESATVWWRWRRRRWRWRPCSYSWLKTRPAAGDRRDVVRGPARRGEPGRGERGGG